MQDNELAKAKHFSVSGPSLSSGVVYDGQSVYGGKPYYFANERPNDPMSVTAFYRGVRFIGEVMSGIPKIVIQRNKGIQKPLDDHPILPLISEQPNDLVNAIYFWETVFGHAAMYGNGYGWIERRGGKPIALHNLHSLQVIPFRLDGAQFYALRDVRGQVLRDKTGSPVTVKSADMIHIRNYSDDGEKGISVVELLAMQLGTAKKLDQFLWTYFEHGAAVNVVVEAERGLTPSDIDSLKHGIDTTNVGLHNAHNVMVLVGAKAKSLTSPLKDFAYEIIKPATVDDIACALGLPPHTLYQLTKATNANIEQLGTELVKFSLGSWAYKAELECSLKLLTPAERKQGVYVSLDLNGLQRGDFATRRTQLRADYLSGLVSREEWRASEGYSTEIEGYVVQPGNVGAVGPDVPVVGDGPNVGDDPSPTADGSSAPAAGSGPVAADADAQAAPGGAVGVQTPSDPTPTLPNAYGRFLADVASRVKAKQAKAFANHAKLDGDKATAWGATFAEQQGDFLAEALTPFVETVGVAADPTDRVFALTAVADDYRASVLRDGEAADPQTVIDKLIAKADKWKE